MSYQAALLTGKEPPGKKQSQRTWHSDGTGLACEYSARFENVKGCLGWVSLRGCRKTLVSITFFLKIGVHFLLQIPLQQPVTKASARNFFSTGEERHWSMSFRIIWPQKPGLCLHSLHFSGSYFCTSSPL